MNPTTLLVLKYGLNGIVSVFLFIAKLGIHITDLLGPRYEVTFNALIICNS
jgi:hypothetical protein